ncbi:MAG: DUF1571 domain-containing protein [Gemmataceae bacterium]|nr:DUF1571 domain-containing protein [Gemmataceae bacterium]
MPSHDTRWSRTALRLTTCFFGLAFVPCDFLAYGQDKVIPAANLVRSSLDQPIEYLLEAKRNYTVVKDYSCIMVSQERVGGKLGETNMMQMKVKAAPFSVWMKWIAPDKSKNQEVAFVAGKNNNKMKVKSNLLVIKAVGFLSIAPDDPRVLERSRHTILEAGIGNSIEQNLRHWQLARQAGKSKATISEAEFNKRACIRVEIVSTERVKDSYCCRTVLFFEKISKLPIHLENYDWPRQGGPSGGELLESFGYMNLQFNTGLKDSEFEK